MANPAPSFNCDKCFKKFTAKHNFNIHSRTVHKKLEECSLCHHVVKSLVQHRTRYHANVNEGRTQCQDCFRCLCAAHIAEDSQQVSSLTVSKNRLASTPIPSPQHSTSRSVPLLLLNDTNSTDQISSSKLPCNDAPSPSNLARLDFLMGMTAPLDPKKGPPELLATYPGGIHDTVSISLSSRLHNRGITSTSSTQGTLNIDLLDRDIPTLSIESCDADHPSTEEPPTAGYGFDWMTWEEFTSCNFNTLEQ